ncbi:acyltransferase family protein [Fibrobacter sp. UWEL]|uniref:acyltransferase family protein n=1 Tax=Fibrobacter sp. UWEL TaxID=1896209 RepID=UPI0009112708|nr:acyltransferase family protein [Fibrobacter sp. UWEL]SHL40287.1 Fucose 4-O-acetylase [Fibrobacter sp. UWEL]
MAGAAQNRIQWIDEFKGFVLLLVCLFHVEQSFKCVSLGMESLSAMRMSAFFFISGVLFSTRRFSDFKSYATHKTKVLLLPYLWLSLLFLALDPVMWNFDWFPRAPKMTVMNIRPEILTLQDYIGWNFAKIFVAGKSSIGSGPLWFVFTLYSISLMFYGIQSATKHVILSERSESKNLVHRISIILIATASLTAGWILFKNHIRLPLGIERDCTCLAFFAFGWLCKEPIQKLSNVSGKAGTIGIFAGTVAAFVLYFLIDEAHPWFSIMNNTLGKNIFRFVGSSLFGIAGLIGLFQLLSKLPHVAPIATAQGILRNISRNALIILAVHWWVLLVLRIIFKTELDKPGIAYLSIPVVAVIVLGAIPLFRNKLYKLLGKEKISCKESLSIK